MKKGYESAFPSMSAQIGLTVRDAFAIAALQGLLSRPSYIEAVGGLPSSNYIIAKDAFLTADAMIAQREKGS